MNAIKISGASELDVLIKELLHNSLKETMSLIHAECGSLFLIDQQHKELVLNAFYNSDRLELTGLRKRMGEGICGMVASAKIPILVKDISHDSRFKRNGFKHYKTGSFISIPLCSNAQGLIGLINLADKSSGEPFSDQDLNVALSIAKYACAAIDAYHYSVGLKQEKEDLHKQKSLLEKYASVGKLAAGVVHEVNNPLDGIIRYTNMLLSQMDDNSVAREYLLEMKKGLHRIANITKSLLEFSHQVNPTSTSVRPRDYLNLHDLINETMDLLEHKMSGDVRVKKNYYVEMPRVLDLGIQHVVVNLLNNALDAMPLGGMLEITTDIEESFARISIKDTGSGIASEHKERIFEPFFTTKSIEKGTGLGLAITKEVIHKYDGKIEVESAAGAGSTFTVFIPKKYLEHG